MALLNKGPGMGFSGEAEDSMGQPRCKLSSCFMVLGFEGCLPPSLPVQRHTHSKLPVWGIVVITLWG